MDVVRKVKIQDRKFWGILYPDSTTYNCSAVIEIIQSYFTEWAWILHDKDLEPDGTLKKPHIHWMGLLPSPTKIKTISNKLGVEENYIRFADKWRNVARYLVHDTKDSEDKYQYSVDEVNCNFDICKYISRLGVETQAVNIYDAIVHQGKGCYSQLIPWAIQNGCYSELVRAHVLWAGLMKECPARSSKTVSDDEINKSKSEMMKLLKEKMEEDLK